MLGAPKLYTVPAELFAAAGLRPGGATERSFRCESAGIAFVPIAQIRGPTIAPGKRGLDRDRLDSIISGIAAGVALPPVPVYWEAEESKAVLLDGAHRFAVSIVYGFCEMPSLILSIEEARDGYNYPESQR